jgi:hypothetical protein
MSISCATEVFTEHVRKILEGITGQVNMTDDVVIQGGTTNAQSVFDCGAALASVQGRSSLAVDRPGATRIRRSQRGHRDEVRGPLPKGLGDRGDIRREPCRPWRSDMPVQPSRSKAATHRVHRFSTLDRRRKALQPSGEEALGVVWLCERAAIYLIGHRFRIIVDNRAVMLIYGNSKSKLPARIERWALRLTSFDFEIVHRPGNQTLPTITQEAREPLELQRIWKKRKASSA